MQKRSALALAIALGFVTALAVPILHPVEATSVVALDRHPFPAICNGGGTFVSPQKGAIQTLLPSATGTLRSLPELGILERAPVANDIQSTYFRTTEANREFRRGFVEFSIPEFPRRVVAATLILPEGGGWSAAPQPPDTHLLSYYPADLSVDLSDYDRPARLIGCFETDVNIAGERFAFDVTRLVGSYGGTNLGFRIRLAADPARASMGFLGADFQSPVAGDPVRIEIVTAK